MSPKIKTALLPLLLTAVAASAGERLTIAVPEDTYPPYVIHDNDGEAARGRLIDPLRRALDELDIELVLEELPILRSRPMLEAGQLDGRMESSYWAPDAGRYLWLDVGVWLEDVLLYRNDLTYEPLSLAALKGSEVIAHLGYRYPTLDPLFSSGFLTRIDRIDEASMIDSLLHAPEDSQRLMVIERGVWDWYLPNTDIPKHLSIREGAITVGCAPLQIQLADTERLRALQPKIQAVIDRQLAGHVNNGCHERLSAQHNSD
ncbi:hypothetical protein ACQUQU_17655 [Thalassolituus sp. LLYu03]|uniref:hypothetical protein n=1 Tax=Thalassolituus sp. LLYu03 TaxID=3421656 RepID=UPI003D28326A